MARAKQAIATEGGLYQRDFRLWVEEQARLLRGSEFERLDIANLVEEIEDLGIAAKKAVKSNLVVVLLHLLKHQFQPRRRSRSWQASILEHRQRLRDDSHQPQPERICGGRVRGGLRRRSSPRRRRDRPAGAEAPTRAAL